ncbi:MAG: CPBP family intramembrane metalloprotease [Butyrivibrio sp.]|nr:CPBP family intramembrane metalloprotease [Butyrivibrio sp.]
MNDVEKKEKFTEKHPVIGLLLVTYGSFLVAQYVIGLILVVPLSKLTGLEYTEAMPLGVVIGSFIVLIFWNIKRSPEYHFMPGKGDTLEAVKLVSPVFLYCILLFSFYALFIPGGKFTFAAIPISDIFACLMAGISEEIIFREIAIPYMTKRWNSEKMIPIFAGISAVMFGLVHLTNGISGNITGSILQSVLSVLWGYFFSAVYLRNGNICVLAIAHTLYDMLVFSNANGLEKVGISVLPDWIQVVYIILESALAIYGYFLLRKSKREEILKFWDHKWSRD